VSQSLIEKLSNLDLGLILEFLSKRVSVLGMYRKELSQNCEHWGRLGKGKSDVKGENYRKSNENKRDLYAMKKSAAAITFHCKSCPHATILWCKYQTIKLQESLIYLTLSMGGSPSRTLNSWSNHPTRLAFCAYTLITYLACCFKVVLIWNKTGFIV